MVNLYRQPAAGSVDLAGLAVDVASTVYDPLTNVKALVLPFKQRFGAG